MIDEQKFFAWLDGELGEADGAEMAAAVAASADWSRKASDHRALQSRLQSAFAPMMAAPIPDRIGVEPSDFGAAMARREASRASWRMPQWASLAATLVLGIGLGTVVGSGGTSSPVAVEQGRLVASAGLEAALDTQLASAPADSGPRIGLTFRDQAGALCRSFSDGAASGLACRDSGAWRVRGLFQGPGRQGDYRMAAGQDPRLAALIEDSISGEPLDAADEQKALGALR